MALIAKIPIIGNLVVYFLYFTLRLGAPLFFGISGYKKLRLGKCVIWTPKDREQVILKGIDFLRKRDSEIFSLLTTSRLMFFWTKEKVKESGGRIFAISEQFVKWGPEGIAVNVVLSFLKFKTSPEINRFKAGKENREAIKTASEQMLEWMRQHSMQDKLIKAYRMASEKWVAENYFQN
ncbi:MAG TPA: hypothetical protein VHG71_08030 [Verrucomicrobiae bacterium]|nr:hypothetical protein [Verrucomicrobiae bacterium]